MILGRLKKLFLILEISLLASSDGFNLFKKVGGGDHRARPYQKLLTVVIDGFRWDYLTRFSHRSGLPFSGFQEFMDGGVHTEYLTSVFPSESFPTWQTINTGLYPGNHGILAKQFYDPEIPKGSNQGKGIFFDYREQKGTDHASFWQKAKPIWATAAQQGIKMSTYLWGRCDVPWMDPKPVSPAHCESVFQKDGSKTMRINMEKALIDFQQGFDASIVYEHSLGAEAEKYGPLSIQVEERLRSLDEDLMYILDRVRKTNMDDMVNIILISDHGMAYGATPQTRFHPQKFPVEKFKIHEVSVGEALQPVKPMVNMVVGYGAYAIVYPNSEEFSQQIAKQLKENLDGVRVYRQGEIPDHLHWKDDRKTSGILVLAERGTVIRRAGSQLQKPSSNKQQKSQTGSQRQEQFPIPKGLSGYDPEDKEMRGIFMARGPGFIPMKEAQPPIELVDIYQMLCHLMDVQQEPNDGVWERIKSLLRNSSLSILRSAPCMSVLIIGTTMIFSFNGRIQQI